MTKQTLALRTFLFWKSKKPAPHKLLSPPDRATDSSSLQSANNNNNNNNIVPSNDSEREADESKNAFTIDFRFCKIQINDEKQLGK